MIFISGVSHAQVGGRIKEGINQKRFKKKIFKGGWTYRKTKPGKVQTHWREGRHLFKRSITKNKVFKYKLQQRINRERARRRVHGNDVFARRKY